MNFPLPILVTAILTWQNIDVQHTYYNYVWKNGIPQAQSLPSDTKWTDTNALVGDKYKVGACNDVGCNFTPEVVLGQRSVPSAVVSFAVAFAPVVTLISDLTATKVSNSLIRLTWTAPSDPRVVYVIVQASVNGAAFALVINSKTLASAGRYDYAVPGAGAYKFRVRLWDSTTTTSYGYSNETIAITI